MEHEVNLEQIREINYTDLQSSYFENGASRIADLLKRLFSSDRRPYSPSDWTRWSRPEAILFSPFRRLIRFYSLLEIALIIKFIPEPNYEDDFWKVIANVSAPLIRSYEAGGYPVVLPQFLLGRLEGRSHLEEESVEERYDEASALFSSFVSLTSVWDDPDVESFLRFVMSEESDSLQGDLLTAVVAEKTQFIRDVLAARSGRSRYEGRLVGGFSKVLVLCEDLDRLLEEAGDFRLLQSAMWNYHADLFLLANGRLPSYLHQLVRAFGEWRDQNSSDEEMVCIYEYVDSVKRLVERLSSGAYGNYLLQAPVTAPLAPALA